MQANLWLLLPAVLLLVSVSYLFSLKDVPQEVIPEHLGWIESTVTPQGHVFSYPRELEHRYYSAAAWPPLVEVVANEYSCVLDATAVDGALPLVEERTIGGRTYCVSERNEGTAGTTYTTYEYSTDRGDAVLRAVFTIRFPQCANYNDAEQEECELDQASFDPDELADGMIDSVRLP